MEHEEVRELIEDLCSAAVSYGERDTMDAEQDYYAAKAKLIGAVRSQDEALLRQAREALRLVSLYVHDFAPDSDAKQFSAALSALNARLGDSKKEMSE